MKKINFILLILLFINIYVYAAEKNTVNSYIEGQDKTVYDTNTEVKLNTDVNTFKIDKSKKIDADINLNLNDKNTQKLKEDDDIDLNINTDIKDDIKIKSKIKKKKDIAEIKPRKKADKKYIYYIFGGILLLAIVL